jgi:hypothetical protein
MGKEPLRREIVANAAGTAALANSAATDQMVVRSSMNESRKWFSVEAAVNGARGRGNLLLGAGSGEQGAETQNAECRI